MTVKGIIVAVCLGMSVSCVSFAAKLCGAISTETKWHGGVFSILRMDGKTIATTPYVSVGAQGCTDVFPDGTYIIRFNGVLEHNLDALPKDGDPIYGCITAPFVFSAAPLFIVFNQGVPPFNGNHFCFPPMEAIQGS